MSFKRYASIIVAVMVTGTLFYIVSSESSRISTDSVRERALKELKDEGSLFKSKEKIQAQGLFNEKTIDYSKIRKALPENRTPLSREESENFRKEREKRRKLRAKIESNRASDQEIDTYYREQEALTRDMLEVCNYILKSHENSLDERTLKKYSFVREQFELRLERIPAKKQEDIVRIKEYRRKREIKE